MTQKIYLDDMYLKEIDATVTKVDGNKVYLDRTIFYPTGGGQPNDTGKIRSNDLEVQVIDVKKEGEEVAHTLENPGSLKQGDKVHCTINWENRYGYMRHHTALHLVDGVMAKFHPTEGRVTGGQIYADRARMDFDMPTLNREVSQKIIEQANQEIEQDRKVIVRSLSRQQALEIPNLSRTEPGRELLKKLDIVRVVEIEGVDAQADGGLHVRSLKELGKISFGAFKNNGSHSKRLEIKLE